MNRLLIPTLAALMTLSASSVSAAEITDKIKSMDAEAHTVTLDDGKVYTFAQDYDLSKLKTGDEVDITFETNDGKNDATDVKSAM